MYINNNDGRQPPEFTAEGSADSGGMTDSFGHPITNDTSSLTVGESGPVLLEDLHFIDKLSHFDRERIPERVVHAKGTGALGIFQTYESMAEYTTADFLQKGGAQTPALVRFSTVIGGRGSADTVRDPRGFATKFYTNEGIYDLVGNDLPVFFIRDAIKFPDVIHSLKPSPDNNVRDAQRFWDFISLTPEATHMISWLYSDRGTIRDYRNVDGFGVNTYVWLNGESVRHFVKYHWKTMQGLETISRAEAEEYAGSDPDVAVRRLHDAIEAGDFPKYELYVQLMTPEEAEKLPFDPLDDTKTWSESLFPLKKVGLLTLNKNPQNFFAQIEQAAFCPANLVPGIELSADKMLQGRSFSYNDTQRHRISEYEGSSIIMENYKYIKSALAGLVASHTLMEVINAIRNLYICFVDGALSLHSTNGRKQKSRQKALLQDLLTTTVCKIKTPALYQY